MPNHAGSKLPNFERKQACSTPQLREGTVIGQGPKRAFALFSFQGAIVSRLAGQIGTHLVRFGHICLNLNLVSSEFGKTHSGQNRDILN